MRWLTLPLLLLLGCQTQGVGPQGVDRGLIDSISDEELKRTGQWTETDATARRILVASRRARPETLKRLTLRRAGMKRKLLDPVRVGEVTVPLPDLGALFGFDYQEWAWVLPTQNAVLLLHVGQPPTILPIDPDRPIPALHEETPERVYQALREHLRRDLRGLPPQPRPERPRP